MMSTTGKPRGHLQVKGGKNGRRRTFHAFWWDAEGKHGRCLGPAHVRDTGRRTARKAVIWRAGDGPKPTPGHVTPKEAEDLLDDILREAEAGARTAPQPELAHQLTLALEPNRPMATVTTIRPVSGNATPAFLERLEEEIPAKWLREVARLYAETDAQLSA